MTTWFTADLHFGHPAIVGYCGRPYPDLAAMTAGLVTAWNATVAPTDEVWILGDLALGPLPDTLAVLAELHGTLRLVPGNHDRCWRGAPGAAGWAARYTAAGIATIADTPAPLPVAGATVQLSHFPYTGVPGHPDRYAAHRPVDTGGWLLHGHVHERWRQRDRMLNVGVDAWGGRPVALETLAACIAAGPATTGPLPWGATTP